MLTIKAYLFELKVKVKGTFYEKIICESTCKYLHFMNVSTVIDLKKVKVCPHKISILQKVKSKRNPKQA